MPIYGPGNFGAISNDAAVGTVAWTNPSFAQTEDGAGAQAGNIASGDRYSQYLKAVNANPGIAEGETPTRLKLRIKRQAGALGQVDDHVLQLVVAGVVSGNNKAATGVFWPAGGPYAYAEYDYSVEEWGVTPTVAQLNAADFGVALQANLFSTAPDKSVTGDVDHIEWTITTDPAPPAVPSFVPRVRVI